MKLSSAIVSEIRDELNQAASKGEIIRVEQRYFGKTEVKTYRFKTGFPNGFKSHSVTGWYSTDFKHDGLYMSSRDFANYISNVNGGRGGLHITYLVERIVPALEQTNMSHSSTKPPLSSIIESSGSKPQNIKGTKLTKDYDR